MKLKSLLISVALISCLVLTGYSCSVLGPKDLTDKDDQKDFIEEANDAFKEEEGVVMEGEIEGAETTAKINKDGDMHMTMSGEYEGQQMDTEIIMVDNKSYQKINDVWYAMGEGEDSEDNIFEMEYEDADIDDDKLVYEGIEELDGDKYYVFTDKTDESEDEHVKVWFDVDTKLPYQIEYINGDEKGTTVKFTYEKVEIEAPSDYKTQEEYLEMIMGDTTDIDY